MSRLSLEHSKSKNVGIANCYNFYKREPILVAFGWNIIEKKSAITICFNFVLRYCSNSSRHRYRKMTNFSPRIIIASTLRAKPWKQRTASRCMKHIRKIEKNGSNKIFFDEDGEAYSINSIKKTVRFTVYLNSNLSLCSSLIGRSDKCFGQNIRVKYVQRKYTRAECQQSDANDSFRPIRLLTLHLRSHSCINALCCKQEPNVAGP